MRRQQTMDEQRWLNRGADERVYRVSPGGELPTVQAARDRIRALTDAERAQRPIRVLIESGEYELAQPFELGPADSGTPDAPIFYQAAPGARSRLSGGRRIAAFTETLRDGRRVWTADLPEVRTGAWWFTQLFVNDRRAARARWPKAGFLELIDASADRAVCEAGFAPGDLKAWDDLDDAEATVLHFWVDSHLAIEQVDELAHRVRFRHPGVMRLNDERLAGRCRFFVENIGANLTEPGEWHVSRRTGTLTYLPLPDETLGNTSVVAPRLTQAVVFAGEPTAAAASMNYANPGRTASALDAFPPDRTGMRGYAERLSAAAVHDVHLVGIEVCHTEWHYPDGDPGPAQAAFTVPAAVALSHCHDCSMRLCRLARVGGYGIALGQGARRVVLAGNRLDDLGAGGIKLEHDSHFNTVSDNTITRGGRRFPSAIGIWVGHSGDNAIRHNRVDDFFYTGLSLGWIWGYRPSRARRNRVEYNVVTRIGQGILSDLGGIYTLGVSPGTCVRSNVFRHMHCFSYGGTGLYPDEGTGYVQYEGNLVEDCDSGTIHMNYGRDCLFRGNLLIEGGGAQVGWGTPKHFRPMRVERNAIVFSRGACAQGNWFASPALVEFDGNLWFRRDGRPLDFSGHDWAQWRQLGFDAQGVNADPLLTDDTGRPFAWRADSPLTAIGFPALDVDRAGPRREVLETGRLPASRDAFGPVVWAQLESAEPLPEGARYEDRFVHYPETTPCTLAFQAVLENAGDRVFAGDVDLALGVAEGGRVEGIGDQGPRRVPVRLKAGQRVILPLTVAVGEGVRELVLRVSGEAAGFHGTALGFGFRPVVRTPRLPSGIAASAIAQALEAAEAPELPVVYGRHRLGAFRIGLAGDDLAFMADVNDDPITLIQPAFKGSMIDLFGIGGGKSLTGQVSETFGQLFLIPGDGRTPARLTNTAVGDFQGADLHFALRPGGYRLAARIPLSALKIAVADGEFAFTAAIYTHVPGVDDTLRANLFGQRSLNDPHAYGRMRIV